MKNLVVFITPHKKFYGEYIVLTKILIDNSLDLGWKPEDILLVTNFEYEYNGVKSIEVGDENFCKVRPRSIKTSIIPHLAEKGIVKEGELYWNHDLDAFQLDHFNGIESEVESVDIGLTDYGWKPRWCMGSYFFKESAKDVFGWLKDSIFQDIEDETVMESITKRNTHNINSRIKRLNITYNFGMRNVEENYERTIKPIKVAHFHPTYKLDRTWNVFVLGKNGLNMPLVDERMIGIFNHHGINGK